MAASKGGEPDRATGSQASSVNMEPENQQDRPIERRQERKEAEEEALTAASFRRRDVRTDDECLRRT